MIKLSGTQTLPQNHLVSDHRPLKPQASPLEILFRRSMANSRNWCFEKKLPERYTQPNSETGGDHLRPFLLSVLWVLQRELHELVVGNHSWTLVRFHCPISHPGSPFPTTQAIKRGESTSKRARNLDSGPPVGLCGPGQASWTLRLYFLTYKSQAAVREKWINLQKSCAHCKHHMNIRHSIVDDGMAGNTR